MVLVAGSRSQNTTSGFANKVQGDVNGEIALLDVDGDIKASSKGVPAGDIVGEDDSQDLTNKKFTDVNALSMVFTNSDQELTSDPQDSIVQKMLGRAFQYFMAGG